MAAMVSFAGWRAVEDDKTLMDEQEPKPGRTYTMYHGTHKNNAEDIIINGFKQSSRGMLGKGVYVSRNIEKAKCYPLRTDKKEKVVFKLSVKVGKVLKIDCDNHPMRTTWHDHGYDCVWIPPHSNVSAIKSGREEDCVWDPKSITVVDIACCVDQGERRKLRNLIRTHVRRNECSLCQKSSPTLPHDVQNCWECGERICPLESVHICRTD